MKGFSFQHLDSQLRSLEVLSCFDRNEGIIPLVVLCDVVYLKIFHFNCPICLNKDGEIRVFNSYISDMKFWQIWKYDRKIRWVDLKIFECKIFYQGISGFYSVETHNLPSKVHVLKVIVYYLNAQLSRVIQLILLIKSKKIWSNKRTAFGYIAFEFVVLYQDGMQARKSTLTVFIQYKRE